MPNTNPVLIDLPLVPDEDALEELGTKTPRGIADENWQGGRLLLTLGKVRSAWFDGEPGGTVELLATFHPAPRCRFVWATILLKLLSPTGVTLLDLAPREIRESEPVKFTLTEKGSLSVSYEQFLNAGIGADVQAEYKRYYYMVHGSGAGTATARWDFEENPTANSGLNHEQSLILSLPGHGEFIGELTFSAQLARPGLAGGLDAIADMVLGARRRFVEVRFTIPALERS